MNDIIMAQIDKALAAKADSMPLKPRVKVKAKGIPIGSLHEIEEVAGRMKVKPKRRKPGQTLNQMYKDKNRKKWTAAK